MPKARHNIICLECEWSLTRDNNFSLRTADLLNFFSDFYGCDFIHRVVPTNSSLRYYLDYFSRRRSKLARYDLIYISCHGDKGEICIEEEPKKLPIKEEQGGDKNLWVGPVSLIQLAEAYPTFFEGKCVHFSSCRTLADEVQAQKFLNITQAKMVSGYCSTVDAMQCAIADLILFNGIFSYQRISTLNSETGKFRNKYGKILDELKFKMYV